MSNKHMSQAEVNAYIPRLSQASFNSTSRQPGCPLAHNDEKHANPSFNDSPTLTGDMVTCDLRVIDYDDQRCARDANTLNRKVMFLWCTDGETLGYLIKEVSWLGIMAAMYPRIPSEGFFISGFKKGMCDVFYHCGLCVCVWEIFN